MVIDINKVADLLKGISKISDIKIKTSQILQFRLGERNSDFVRNRFHVLGQVFYSEYVKDWKGNLSQGIYYKIVFAAMDDYARRNYISNPRNDRIIKAIKDKAGLPDRPTSIFIDQISASDFKNYLLPDRHEHLYALCVSITHDFDGEFAIEDESQIIRYLKGIINALFSPDNYENMMEYMFHLPKIQVVPEIGGNAN
ncbi:MAG: hypothetical protein K5925_02275 [Bacilli bacterium]|nr:hypothetical protein [Bacilli bacterium]